MTAGAAPALPIGALAAEDFSIIQNEAGNVTAVTFIRNQVACRRRVLRIGRLGNVSLAQAPVLINICFRDDVFRVKLFILRQGLANLGNFQNTSRNVCRYSLCSGKLGRGIRLVLRSLFIIRQAPCALVGDSVLRYLFDFAVPHHSAQNQFDQRAGVVPEVARLDAGHGFLIVLHVPFAGGIFTRWGTAKEPSLRDMAHSRQHCAGIVQNVLNTSHRQGLNAHILAICINKDHVQQIAGKVKHFHTLKHRIVTVCRRQNVGKVLHFVCYHRQPFQQSNGVARADAGIPQFFTDAHILRNAPCTVEVGHRGAFGDLPVMEYQAAGRMHHITAVHAVHLVKLRDARTAFAVVFIVRVVLIAVDPQREHLVAAVNQQFCHAVNIPPVQRVLKKSAIVHQHNNSGATEKTRPFQRLCKFALVVNGLQVVIQPLLQVFILDTQVNAILGGIIRWGINDGRKQTISCIKVGQFRVCHSSTSCPLVILGAIVLGAILVQDVVIAIEAKLWFDFTGNNFFHLFSFPAIISDCAHQRCRPHTAQELPHQRGQGWSGRAFSRHPCFQVSALQVRH